MAKDVNYNFLKERLYSKKEDFAREEIQAKKDQEPSRYKLIKEKLKGEPSIMKADAIMFSIGLPKNLYDDRLSLPSENGKEKWGYAPINDRGEKKRIKEIVKNYTKKDVEEAIINELHELDSKGIQSTINYGNQYGKKQHTKYSDIDDRTSEFGESFDNIKKLETLLSSKRFLKKHGVTSDEIKKYEETFKKRVGRVLNNAVEFAKRQDTQKMTENMLNYAKKEGLINYKRTGIEKSLAVLSIGSILAGIFFLSPNLTGNVIGNVAKSSGNIFGGLLFILGIVGAFFTLKK